MPKRKYAEPEDFLKEIACACVLLDVHLKTINPKRFVFERGVIAGQRPNRQ